MAQTGKRQPALTNSSSPDAAEERTARLADAWGKLRAGDHKAAIAAANAMAAANEPTAPELLFAGEAHFAMGNFRGTDNLANRAIDIYPDDINARVLKCRALMAMGQLGPARDQALELASMEISDERHIEVLVTILGGLMEPAAAYPLCRQSVERNPADPRAQRRLALTCRMIGRFDEAQKAAEIAIAANPHDYEMIGLRSAVSTATPDNNHIAAMEKLTGLSPQLKQKLVNACISAVLADDHASTRELEVTRSLCATMDVPMPPVLTGQDKDADVSAA